MFSIGFCLFSDIWFEVNRIFLVSYRLVLAFSNLSSRKFISESEKSVKTITLDGSFIFLLVGGGGMNFLWIYIEMSSSLSLSIFIELRGYG